MGACASVPKAMRGEAAAPAPEQPKEETAPEVVAEVKAEGEKPEAAEKEAPAADEKHNSLNSLMNEGEAKQESTAKPEEVAPSTEEKAPEAEVKKEEEPKTESTETKVEEVAKEEEKTQQ